MTASCSSRQDWLEYCLFILPWFPPRLMTPALTWPHNALRAAGQGLFVLHCHPSSRASQSRCPRAVVLHQSHTSYPLYAGRDFRRSFDEMPSRTSLARQRSLCCRESVKQQDDGFGISPRSGLSGQTCRQLAIENTIRSGDSLMSVVPSIIVLVITALLVFRRELTSRPAASASTPPPGANRS